MKEWLLRVTGYFFIGLNMATVIVVDNHFYKYPWDTTSEIIAGGILALLSIIGIGRAIVSSSGLVTTLREHKEAKE